MICPGCRTLNFRDYKFCRECGHKLEAASPTSLTVTMGSAPDADDDDAKLQQLLDAAFLAYEAGNLSEAALACQGALAIRPESTAAHSLLGLVYERQGQVPDAIQQYRIVLDLNPSSRADRAKLNALLRQTGQARPSLLERVRLMPRGMLVGGVATLLVFVSGLLALARSTGTPEPPQPTRAVPGYQTAVAPNSPPPYPPAPAYVPQPAPPAPAPGGADFSGFPRRTMSNAPLPVTNVAVAAPPVPRRRQAASGAPPTFLAPAPIRGLDGLSSGAAGNAPVRRAGGSVPVLPDPQAEPTAGQPGSAPAPPQPQSPPLAPAPGPVAETPLPGASISIRRLDAGSAPSAPVGAPSNPVGAQPSPPTLAEARYHFALAADMQRRGDLAGAYREYGYARELFRIVNSRGGTEGALAADGAMASHRAMQQLSPGQQ